MNTYSAMNKYSSVFFDKNPLVLCLADRPGMDGRRETIIHNVKPGGMLLLGIHSE